MVSQTLNSGRDAPVYNIKAVARLTGVAADTLRRWESRYGVLNPERTESGYRLYSQRDVDTILWLKLRLQEGMSISRASEMLRQVGNVPGPQPPFTQNNPSVLSRPPSQQSGTRSFSSLHADLSAAFRGVDEVRAGEVLTDALNLYSVEDVCISVLQPALVDIGQAWQEGEVSVAVEHFASSFTRARLENLFHAGPHNAYGPLVLVGCAPEELHELGAMFLAVFLRRAGYRVIYLGQNVPLDSLIGMVRTTMPQAVCISASRAETASSLYELRGLLDDIEQGEGHTPLLAYGGRVFNSHPHISERLGGIYLGENARAAVQALDKRLRGEK
jgi:DNA-binding transcriptional MerR regulator/methylmalonyl-CoA mutase cobalamin-binding subunit